MKERTTEQVPRNGWRPGFYMRPKHVGLVFCVSLVGCMVAFGAGFIAGMGYKADEQVSPYVARSVQTVEAQEQGEGLGEGTLTFYGQLRKKRPDIMIPEVEATQPPQAAPAELTLEPTPTPEPSPPIIVAEEIAPQATDRTVAATETPPVAPAPAPLPTLQELPVVAERTNPEPPVVDPTDTPSLGTNESVVETYSVQVASFLKPELAKRMVEELTEEGYYAYLHPFEAPGQPLWYRVKVGKFADRDTANLALEKLGTPDAMITRD